MNAGFDNVLFAIVILCVGIVAPAMTIAVIGGLF